MKDELTPAIIQDSVTGRVLMLGYMNAEALERTLATGEVHYFSRSRNELWHKGATSGHTQRVVSLHADCDADAVLARVHVVLLELRGCLGDVLVELDASTFKAKVAQAEAAKDGGGVDFVFDIPLDLAEDVTGFRHDALGFDEDIPVFSVLERTRIAEA